MVLRTYVEEIIIVYYVDLMYIVRMHWVLMNPSICRFRLTGVGP